MMFMCAGRLERRFQEETGWGIRYDTPDDYQQRKHQRKPRETVEERRNLYIHWIRAHIR
jgi:hypothetical protein